MINVNHFFTAFFIIFPDGKIPVPLSSRVGDVPAWVEKLWTLLKLWTKKSPATNALYTIEKWYFSTPLRNVRNDSGAEWYPCHSCIFSQTRPSLKALRKAWKERAHRQIPRWNCPIHRRTLSSGFSIAKAIDFFLSSWPKRIWKLRTHWTGLRPGALMYSSLRDGLQPNQEPGIFLWPLPGPFPCSHLFSIIPDREENGNRKYRNYVC